MFFGKNYHSLECRDFELGSQENRVAKGKVEAYFGPKFLSAT